MEEFKKAFLEEANKLNINKEIAESAVDFVINHYKTRKRNDRTHDLLHFLRVLKYSLLIIKKENLDLNKNQKLSLFLSVLFHDLGLFYVEKPKDIDESIKLFKEFAKDVNLDKEIKNLVITSIKEHSFSANKRQTNIVSKILYDADKLDASGFYGVYRASVFSDKILYNPLIDYKDLLAKLKARKLDKNDLNKLNDKKFVLDHYFIKIARLVDKLNFNWSKDKILELNKSFELFILKVLDL